MTLDEFVGWVEFNKVSPITDHHRLYRPAAVIAGALGGNANAALEALSPKQKGPQRALRPVEVIRYPKE